MKDDFYNQFWQEILDGWLILNFVNLNMKNPTINVDPEILGGTPVFSGTRVPIKNLFDYLETDESIETFLEDFEGVKREQVIEVLELSKN